MHNTAYRQNWFLDFLIDNKYRIYRHLLIWVYLLFTEFWDANDQRQYSGNYDLYRYLARILLFILAVYANMYLLVPKLLFKDRYFVYMLALLSLTASVYLIPTGLFDHYFGNQHLPNIKTHIGLLAEIVPGINVLGVAVFASTSIKLFQRWKRDSTRMTDLEKNTLEIELRELKNQINPHFLFNTLNNVNVLIKTDAEKASAVVLKLSDFLRYQLYETSGLSVSLQSEIKFLKGFLELEKIRRDDFTFKLTDDTGHVNTEVSLPPGLFLTFVENAVKYSADPDAPSEVQLFFTICESRLEFICINTKPEAPFFAKTGGLGLTNIARRLELLFPDNYLLKIGDLPGSYNIKLNFPL